MADLLREYAARWQRVLTGPGVSGRRVGVLSWSPLEHGCHVRDMCLLFHARLDTTLGAPAPGPDGPPPGPELPVLYSDEHPPLVADELGRAAEALADRFARLSPDDWDRADPRFADEELTVEFFTRHLLHDIVHDLAEVTRA